MKKCLLFSIIFSVSALAEEGMWMPKQLPEIADKLKSAGLKLDPNKLTNLTDFPMGAIVSLGGCSASFISPQGLVVTNHHCIYGSLGHNSKEGRDLIKDGFLAKTLDEELPASPGSRILVTKSVQDVTNQVITKEVTSLEGKKRFDAIESNRKAMVAECEKDIGHRCTVAAYYGSLEYYLIKQLEIKDVRLVYAPPEGVGKFGGDTDNWMWPRHTGDFGFYRAYVSKQGTSAEYSKENVPYVPNHFLKIATKPLSEGDFIMLMGYPGRTNRHRLPGEIAHTFDWAYPMTVKAYEDALRVIDVATQKNADAKIKYASTVAGINNYYKNRKGMVASYANSDILSRKTKEHTELLTWINSDKERQSMYGPSIEQIEQLINEQNKNYERDFYTSFIEPKLLETARMLYRFANESQKPEGERKAGYQTRDLPFIKASLDRIDRSYDASVDIALKSEFLKQYLTMPSEQRNKAFDEALGLKDAMSSEDISKLLKKLYSQTKLSSAAERSNWLSQKPEAFKNSKDSMIRLAVSLYDNAMMKEAEQEELTGKIQKAYAEYMRSKLAYMKSINKAVYPDANSTLRVTFGNIKGRTPGADGTNWTAFTTSHGILAKATGEGEFNAPQKQLERIRAKDFGPYADNKLDTLPVNYLATLDITGGNSGSAALNAEGEFIGLAFDGTLDSIISDWDFDVNKTRSIQVDYRYMLWQMQKVDNAHNLLKEMGVK